MLSFIIPTRDRPEQLAHTVRALIRFNEHPDRAAPIELIVADNASRTPAEQVITAIPGAHTINPRTIRLQHNNAANARNTAARHAAHPWLVMLDDDSEILPCNAEHILAHTPPTTAAVGGDITLPTGQREAGGMPEVVVGCGVAIRTEAFNAVGGYDPDFEFYVEEYDLCAKLINAGHTVTHARALPFLHRKVDTNRDFNQIIRRLIRNNLWLIQRYAPDQHLEQELNHTIERYDAIANREHAIQGYALGLNEGRSTLDQQPRTPLAPDHWLRFSGRAAADLGIRRLKDTIPDRVRLTHRGKGEQVIRQALTDHAITIDDNAPQACIATLSPGPAADAADHSPDAIALWRPDHLPNHPATHPATHPAATPPTAR